MKPLKVSLFVAYGAVVFALLGVSFSYCWRNWKVRKSEKTIQFRNYRPSRPVPEAEISSILDNAPPTPGTEAPA